LIGASTAFYFSWSKSNSCGAKVWRGITEEKRKRKKKRACIILLFGTAFLFFNSRRMAKNKRKALSAIDKNIVKSQALDLKPSKSNRVNSKARASDVFEPRSKNRIQYVSVSLSESSELQ
jgi:hypothetical protein